MIRAGTATGGEWFLGSAEPGREVPDAADIGGFHAERRGLWSFKAVGAVWAVYRSAGCVRAQGLAETTVGRDSRPLPLVLQCPNQYSWARTLVIAASGSLMSGGMSADAVGSRAVCTFSFS